MRPVLGPAMALALACGGAMAQDSSPSPPSDSPRHGWIAVDGPPGPAEIAANPALFFEGNWHVTWRGNRKMSSAEVWLLKGLMLSTDCGTDGHYATCRDPQAPWFTSGVRAGGAGEAPVVWHQFQVEGLPGGVLKVTHGGGLTSLLRSRGDDELVGTWKDRDGNTGAEIWQREPRPHVDRVRCRYLDGAFVEAGDRPCPVVVRSYPGPDSMRGNLPSMTFDVFGTDMRGAGPLPVVLDWDKTRMEVGSYCYLYEKPFAEGEDHGCASWGDPHETYGKIIGIRVKINVTYGATSGVKTFSIGGVPVSFEARLPPVKILSLGFTEPDSPYSPIGDIAFGERFRVRLAFSRDPGHDSEPVSLSTDDPAATIAIDALRTDDRSVYLSEPVLLLEPQTGEVAQ